MQPNKITLILCGVLMAIAPDACAASGTSQVAWTGRPVRACPGWPEGALDLVNDPLRTDGWHPWFSGMRNDKNIYEFKVRDTDDVNRLIQKFAAINAPKLQVRLNPAREARALGFSTVLKEGNETAVILSIGSQNQVNFKETHQRLPVVDPGLPVVEPGLSKSGSPESKVALTPSPPTLTIYVGHEAVALNNLEVPDKVEVVSDAVPAGQAPAQTVKAIEQFLANRQSNSGQPASASAELKKSAKPGANQPTAKKILGRVTDEAGKPLDRVRWQISAFEEWQDDHWELNHDISTGELPKFFTDGEGRFELNFARRVRFDLQFDKGGFAPAFLYQVAPDVDDLHVVMKRGIPVRGSVVRADSKQPVKGQRAVILRLPTRGWAFQTWTYLSAEGKFEFRLAPPPKEPGRDEPAQWQIVYLGKSVPIHVVDGKPVDVHLEISETDLERYYRDHGGQPTAPAVVPAGKAKRAQLTADQLQSASTSKLEPELKFLSDVPEFHEFNLKMTEERLKERIKEHHLLADLLRDENGKRTYRVFRTDGENVIIGFRDGACGAIQRMRRDIEGLAKLREANSLKEQGVAKP